MSMVEDPLELLARANPVPAPNLLPPTSSYVPAQRTLQRLLDRPLPEDVVTALAGRRPRRRRGALVAAAVAAVAVLTTAAAAWILSRSATDTSRVACYAAATLDADVAPAAGASGVAPLEACADVWRSGSFRSYGAGAVPPLAACVLPTGEAAVFPGDPTVCDRLGLARLATQSGALTTLDVRLVDNLSRALGAPNCVDVVEAAELVREQLDQLGLDGWTLITPATYEQGRPCSSVAFDPPTRTITLVPIPAPATS
jgi:hypothetical protein